MLILISSTATNNQRELSIMKTLNTHDLEIISYLMRDIYNCDSVVVDLPAIAVELNRLRDIAAEVVVSDDRAIEHKGAIKEIDSALKLLNQKLVNS